MMMQKDQKQNNERLQKEIERRRLGLKKPEELKIKKVEEPIEEEEEEENHENKTSHLQTKSYPQNSDIEKENVHEKVNSDFNIDENEIEEEEQFEEEEAQIKNIDKSDTENPEKERNKKNSQMDNQKIDGNLQNKHFSKSIDNLLRSTDSLNERREKGSVLYKNLSPSQIQLFSRLAKLFKSMDTIYDACQIVWNIMKNDSNFEINILLSQIQTSYGDFLIEALISFADSDGIIIPEIVSPK
ncbi:hypothetical protein TRFO_05821 [Tritrichomonas foetus]|uniref:Uncharacterized protein n=1 Tax=Tritrichomonas foetus TaxID=1144522 RepID=A0A1J4K7J8_9EUKA|nr:hypothetical protein TRFO_05821 [Tritrichomonas foetus]|eukprot:OHT05684.1 hypothetical protein TRFO_05821 [Tritrichomonas foetus]